MTRTQITPNNSSEPFTSKQLAPIAVFLILTWGVSFTLVSVAVAHIPPIWLVAGRCALGALLVSAWTLYRGHRFAPLTAPIWRWYLLLGAIGLVVPFYLLSRAQIIVDSGLSAIIVGTMPLLTIILAHFFASEYLTRAKICGFILGFIGTIILFLPDDFDLGLVKQWREQLMILTASMCYAVTTILAKRAPVTAPSMGGAMMLICGASIAFVMALISGVPQSVPPFHALACLVILGVGSTAAGTILYLLIIKKNGPSTLAKINYFPPLVSVIAGIAILGEPFSWKIVIAFALIVTGLLIARIGDKRPAKVLTL